MSGRRGLVVGAVAAVALEAAAAALVVSSGVVDVAATTKRALPDRLLAYASTRSIAHHAGDRQDPLARDPAALKRGLQEYRAMCVACHGGPGAEPEEFASGLHPAPPDLASPAVQAFTDGMLYDAVARGIGSTGMPAFGPTHRPEELWSIVAFVRHLPQLTPEEREALAGGGDGGEDGGGDEGEGHAHAGGDEGHGHARRGGEAHVREVSISSFKFSPQTLTVHVGDAVEWRNEDFVAHTATADEHAFDTGRIDASAAKRVVARKKGRFTYFCRYHAAMKGTLVVE